MEYLLPTLQDVDFDVDVVIPGRFVGLPCGTHFARADVEFDSA